MNPTDEQPTLLMVGVPGWLQPIKKDRGGLHTEETLEKAVNYVADGVTLTAACRMDPTLPSVGVLRTWIKKNSEWAERIRNAEEVCADVSQDQAIDAAKGELLDDVLPSDINRDKLRVDAFKWRAGVLNPGKYGRKETVDISVNVSFKDAMEAGRKRVEDSRHPMVIEHEEEICPE